MSTDKTTLIKIATAVAADCVARGLRTRGPTRSIIHADVYFSPVNMNLNTPVAVADEKKFEYCALTPGASSRQHLDFSKRLVCRKCGNHVNKIKP